MASTIVKSIRISPELWARVEHYAKLDGISANACLVRYIDETLPDPAERHPAPVAQRIERRAPDPKAAGSTPAGSAKPVRSRLKGEWKAP